MCLYLMFFRFSLFHVSFCFDPSVCTRYREQKVDCRRQKKNRTKHNFLLVKLKNLHVETVLNPLALSEPERVPGRSGACQDDDEEESSVYDEDEEEEAKYADQPGCGLSPRLVIKRGVEALQEDERRQREQQGEPSYPVLQRVDTVAGFEHAVDRCDLADVLVSSPRLPKVERVASMSGLPAVADAFEAVEAEAATNAPSCNAADAASKPDPVRRMDTLELLQNPVDNSSEATAEMQTKRQRLVSLMNS